MGMRMAVPLVLVIVRTSSRCAQPERVFGNILSGALDDSTSPNHTTRDFLELIRTPTHDDDFQTMFVIEVHVHRRADLFSEIVLQCRQPFRQLSNMVIVDESNCRKCWNSIFQCEPACFGPCQVTEQFRTVAATRGGHFVEFAHQSGVHRHAEPDQIFLHRARHYQQTPCPASVAANGEKSRYRRRKPSCNTTSVGVCKTRECAECNVSNPGVLPQKSNVVRGAVLARELPNAIGQQARLDVVVGVGSRIAGAPIADL